MKTLSSAGETRMLAKMRKKIEKTMIEQYFDIVLLFHIDMIQIQIQMMSYLEMALVTWLKCLV